MKGELTIACEFKSKVLTMASILDIEASGFGAQSYPIEIGVCLANNQQYCSLIYPEPEWTFWDDSAEKIHGIKRELLIRYGKPVAVVAKELNEFIGNQTVYSDCWVVDQPWLTSLFSSAHIEQQFHLSDLQYILKEPQMAIWHDVKHRVEQDLNMHRHRASADAKIIQQTYQRSLDMTLS